MKDEFKLTPYDSNWVIKFENEKSQLIEVFGENVNSIHHIGSTAIRNTWAKPEIDILLVVKDDSNLSLYDKAMIELGYRIRGECLADGGTIGRFYYSKDIQNKRSYKLHVCKIGHADVMSFLLFVKQMNESEELAQEYSRLKVKLSESFNYGRNFKKYLEGKNDFIKKVLVQAYKVNTQAKYEDFSS